MSEVIGKANVEKDSETLIWGAGTDSDVLVVTSDSRGSAKLWPFAHRFPDQIIEVGIAEQNLVGIAAGLASTGKKVFAVSPASFLSTRALEQIKNDVAYSDHAVTLVGISAGVSYGPLGSTHHSLHDFAVLRAINNIDIVAPADNYETSHAVKTAVNWKSPLYLRFGKKPARHLGGENHFQIGKARRIRSGKDGCFIATGETVIPAFEAAELLRESGIDCGVFSFHSLKPLDIRMVEELAAESGALVTVEEHSIHGGLGEACAAFLVRNRISKPFRIVAIPDEYTVTGSQKEIFNHYGISSEGLAKTMSDLIKERGCC
jgi:transketolase